MKFPRLAKAPNVRTGFLYFALSTTLPVLVIISMHYNMRQAANDPQIQLAEDTAAALNAGQAPPPMPPTKVDIRKSLAPFVIVTDKNRTVLSASGQLDGRVVLPPPGVFEDAKAGQNRVTWQPAAGVRQATVVVPYQGGYVLASRSLREVEDRKEQVTSSGGAVMAALLVFGIVLSLIL